MICSMDGRGAQDGGRLQPSEVYEELDYRLVLSPKKGLITRQHATYFFVHVIDWSCGVLTKLTLHPLEAEAEVETKGGGDVSHACLCTCVYQ